MTRILVEGPRGFLQVVTTTDPYDIGDIQAAVDLPDGARVTMSNLGTGITATLGAGATSTAAVMAVIGQSENVVAWGSTQGSDAVAPPTILAGVDSQIVLPDNSTDYTGSPSLRTIDQATVDAGDVTVGAAAMANLWHMGSGGVPSRFVGILRSGTGMLDMMDVDAVKPDGSDRRIWEKDLAVVTLAQDNWGPITDVDYIWWGSDAAASPALWEKRSAAFFGVNPDGRPYDFATGDLEHCLIDKTGRGYGLLPDDTKVHMAMPGLSLNGPDDTTVADPFINYRTTSEGRTHAGGTGIKGAIHLNSAPAFDERRSFIAQTEARFPENAGKTTIAPNLVRFGDYPRGTPLGDYQTSIHPALQHKDGQILFSQDVAFSHLVSRGHAAASRIKRFEESSDGSYLDMVVSLPGIDATLHTQRIFDGEIVTDPRPHQQEVMGGVLRRAGGALDTERPIFRADYADDDADIGAVDPAYKGTVAIHQANIEDPKEPGTRISVVRITPTQPFAKGDRFGFGEDGNYGGFQLVVDADYFAYLYRDGLRVHEPRLDDGTEYAYPGGPVLNQEAYTITMGASEDTTTTTYVAKTNGETRSLESGEQALTDNQIAFAFEGQLGDQGSDVFGRKGIFSFANMVTVGVDTRAGQRNVQLIVRDGENTIVSDKISANGAIPAPGTDFSMLVTAALDDGTGNAVVKLFVDGAEVADVTYNAVSPANTDLSGFPRSALLLGGDVGMTVSRVATWLTDSPDGSEPTIAPLIDTAGQTADYYNGAGLPTGWTAPGAGDWADV